jgi:cyclase
MPLGYGGGIKTIKDIEKILRIGIEKVVINSAFYLNPKLIEEAAKICGSQSIVVSIDVRLNKKGYSVCIESGRKDTNINPIEYAKKAVDYGAGEILLTSIDKEGLGEGFDYKLISEVTKNVNIPVVASGGASTIYHFIEAMKNGASAVSAGSMFMFHGKNKAVLIKYTDSQEKNEIEKLFD